MESGRERRTWGFVVPPFDPFEPPRYGLTFNFANFFSPVRITRGTTLRPRRKGWLLLSRVTLTFSFFSKAWRGSSARECEEDGEWDQPAMRVRAGKIITPCTPREEYSEPAPGWWAGTKKDRVIPLNSFLFSFVTIAILITIFFGASFWIYLKQLFLFLIHKSCILIIWKKKEWDKELRRILF